MTSYSDEEVKEAIHDLEKNCSGNVFFSPVTWAASQYLKDKALPNIYTNPELDALDAQEALEIVMDGLKEAARKPLSRIDINAYTLWIAMRGLVGTIEFLKNKE